MSDATKPGCVCGFSASECLRLCNRHATHCGCTTVPIGSGEVIRLERPACPICDATLSHRQYWKHTPDGMVMYANGESFDFDNCIEITVCPKCGIGASDR